MVASSYALYLREFWQKGKSVEPPAETIPCWLLSDKEYSIPQSESQAFFLPARPCATPKRSGPIWLRSGAPSPGWRIGGTAYE